MSEVHETFLSDGSRFSAAVLAKADALNALCEAGIGHMLVGRNLYAQLCAQQALAVDPVHADALHLMGLLCVRSGQYDHTVEWASRAIRRDAKPSYLATLGASLLSLGRWDEALQVFDKAVQLKPDDADLWLAVRVTRPTKLASS